MRSKIVSRSSLNKLSRKLGIDVLVKSEISGNGFSKSLLGDAFEAFVGAMYLDKGYNFTKRILIKRVVDVHYDIDKLVNEDTNYKSQLIEWSQKEKIPIEFKVIEEIGNGYGKQYLVEVLIDMKPVATAQDYAIKGAEQLAAEKALALINETKPAS
jgi:ribonuclease-3